MTVKSISLLVQILGKDSKINDVNRKNTISVWGCCVSRNLFNYSLCKDVFDVKGYIFQVAPWTVFEESLNFPEEQIDKLDLAPFVKRMIKADLNKKALTEFNCKIGEFCLIDIMYVTALYFTVSYKGKTIHAQNWRNGSVLYSFKKNESVFKDYSYDFIRYYDVDERILERGLQRFAEYIKQRFYPKNVVVYIPKYTDKYMNDNGEIKEYSKEDLEKFSKDNAFIEKWSRYFASLIDGCKIMLPCDGLIAHAAPDDTQPLPPANHYIKENYIQQGKILLDLLGYFI